jgi:hypothetical protein
VQAAASCSSARRCNSDSLRRSRSILQAPVDERMAFLIAEAKPIEDTIARGMGGQIKIGKTKIDPNRRKITCDINVNGQLAATFNLGGTKQVIYKKLCPGYVTTPLGVNDVTVIQKFIGPSYATLLSIPLSRAVCRQYI